MGGTYYLMFTEEDNSYIIVEDAELVGEAEDVCQHSKISYLYRNRLWMGEVIEKSGDRETLETLMKQLGMKLKRAQAPSKTVSNVVPSDLLGKRKSNPVVKYGEPSTSTSYQLVKKAKRLSQEERHQLDETKKRAERAKKKTDLEILDCLVSPSRNEVMFGESDSDDSDLNDNINSNKKTVAAERQQLVKGIKQLQGQSAAPPGKPKGHSALLEKPEGPSAALVPEKPKGPSAAPVPETPKGPSAAPVPEKPKGPSAAALPEKPTSMNLVEELQKKIALLQAELKAKETFHEEKNEQDQGDVSWDNDNSDLNGNELDDLNQSHDASKDIQNNSEPKGTSNPKEGSAVDKDDDTEYNLEDDDELLTHQLRGKGPKMVALSSRTWCRKSAVKDAHRGTNNIKQAVRRLITGVFIPSQLKNVTVSGYKYRPGSKSDPDRPACEPLHRAALKDVFGYAQALGREKGWKPIKAETLRTVVSHRLVEIKAAVREGKLKDD